MKACLKQTEATVFEKLVHADWSTDPKHRWMATAVLSGRTWRVEAPEPVGDARAFVARQICVNGNAPRRLVGFDFPIGVPAAYGKRTGLANFRALLLAVGTGEWAQFFSVAKAAGEISSRRPFYPHASGGKKQQHLFDGLSVSGMTDLLRHCERATETRRAACSLFWTLGGNQVGKAAISGWREVVRPALTFPHVRLWPFEGALADLAAEGGVVICETYPGEAYAHVGVFFRAGESKRRQEDRQTKAEALLDWAAASKVVLSDGASAAVRDGVGASQYGDDQFDAFAGLLGMIEVVEGGRSEGVPADEDVRNWEGWILGQES